MFGYVKQACTDFETRHVHRLEGVEALGADSVDDGFVNLVAPALCEREGFSLALAGSPRWQDGPGKQASAEQVLEAFLREGDKAFVRLSGGFALAIADRKQRTVLLALDRMGIATLSWTTIQDQLAFSTSSYALAAAPGRTPVLRNQALYDYFFFHMVPAPGSVFEGINKLGRGQVLRWSPGGIDISEYWQPRFDRPSSPRFNDLADELHGALRGAVTAVRPGSSSGAFLSGGLDSSTVAGVLSRQIRNPHTFSIGFGVPEYDESKYARITSGHFGCTAHEYQVTADDVVSAVRVVAGSYDEPFGNSSAIPTYICARFAREAGMTQLLAGDGGDELFGGNERYARHKVFELYNRVPAALRPRVSAAVQRGIDADSSVMPLRKLRSYVDQALIPLPDRFESWNFVYREGARMMFDPDFMAEVDPSSPMEQMRRVFHRDYESPPDLLDRMLLYDWKFTLADNDLRKVGTMCAAAGIDVTFPMLDNRVVDMSLRVPSRTKMPGLSLRHFYRKAMRGFLAEETLKKPKKGFGLPFGVWLKEHKPLGDLVYGSLSDLKQRRIVKAGFLDQLIDNHRRGHPGYYGYIIWDLVILEEWLKQHSL